MFQSAVDRLKSYLNIRLLFISLVALSTQIAHADNIPTGLSAFGIQSDQFQGIICKRFLRVVNHSKSPAIAILFKTFGVNNKCLKQFWNIAKSRNIPHLTEIHFSNEVGRRSGVTDIHDFLPGVTVSQYNQLLEEMSAETEKLIRDRVKEIVALITPHVNTGTFILSTGLEDNFSVGAWTNIYRVISDEWPYEVARSTLSRYLVRQVESIPAEVYVEYHGYRSKFAYPHRCIANGDGQDVNFLADTGVEFFKSKPASLATVKRWLKSAKEKNCISFIWTGKWQGIHSEGKLTRPLTRKFKFDASDMNPIKKLLKPIK